ncbi:GNAT family N-acetyltransferase [Streptomyces endophyticus]|uniref:GNAT family N-acetyltransferase n=1 Tax=Streptomyces endophyticus TaxID=714166 RepID=A0ABU6F0B2_9ACTN|nr:GNAT family N-acetyltransferase [Streptomyces endophyticus]MEB8336900.1 GNAT family N-acetyltransferase [Streptomyces endophyticus]
MSPDSRPLQLRPAQPADAEAVADIWYHGWGDGHRGNVPDALVEARPRDSFDERAAQRVKDTVVAVVDGQVAGFVMVAGDEVEQVYVGAAHRGTAVAPALLSAAEDRVATAGHLRAWLAVVAGNARARRFYARHGWQDEGLFDHHAPGQDGPVLVPAHLYVKDLSGE